MSISMRKVTKLGRCLALALLAAAAVALAPGAALADDNASIDGTFTVTFVYPSATNSCVNGGIPIEGEGLGRVSSLGPLFFKLQKCLTFTGPTTGAYAGTFTLTAADGNTLNGTYQATQDFSKGDANGFLPFQGTLTVAGGSGRFSQVNGVLSFTAIASPNTVDAEGANLGTAYYLVQAAH